MYTNFIKRPVDLVTSVIVLILLSPLTTLVLIIQFTIYGKRAFFLQKRSGIDGKDFYIIKFRTMHDAYDTHGNKLPDTKRITKFGKFLRHSSIDEIPSLFNVLSGQMSLVGPRPLPSHYYVKMSPKLKLRNSVKPGMTGLAQAMGRNNLSWKEKFNFDIIYIQNISFMSDIKIVLRTLLVLFSKKNNTDLGEQSFDNYLPNFDN